MNKVTLIINEESNVFIAKWWIFNTNRCSTDTPNLAHCSNDIIQLASVSRKQNLIYATKEAWNAVLRSCDGVRPAENTFYKLDGKDSKLPWDWVWVTSVNFSQNEAPRLFHTGFSALSLLEGYECFAPQTTSSNFVDGESLQCTETPRSTAPSPRQEKKPKPHHSQRRPAGRAKRIHHKALQEVISGSIFGFATV